MAFLCPWERKNVLFLQHVRLIISSLSQDYSVFWSFSGCWTCNLDELDTAIILLYSLLIYSSEHNNVQLIREERNCCKILMPSQELPFKHNSALTLIKFYEQKKALGDFSSRSFHLRQHSGLPVILEEVFRTLCNPRGNLKELCGH